MKISSMSYPVQQYYVLFGVVQYLPWSVRPVSPRDRYICYHMVWSVSVKLPMGTYKQDAYKQVLNGEVQI